MIRFHGKGVCGGVAIGTIALLQRKNTVITKRQITDTQAELQRLQAAAAIAAQQLTALCDETKRLLGDEEAQIFEIHAMMLEDEDLIAYVTDTICTQQCNAEYAVQSAATEFAARFAAMDDSYMQARAADVRDIGDRLLRCLSRQQDTTAALHSPCILCADDLTPSETAGLSPDTVLGFATAKGSANSHTAILARSMNIPAIVGLGEAFHKALHEGDTILVDGDTGECILSPDAETVRAAEEKQSRIAGRIAALHALRSEETVTADGRKISLYANIGDPKDMQYAIRNGAEGIGLYRSEFLYLQQESYPDEQTQLRAYRMILEQMPDQKVVIRTLDMGADKQAAYFHLPPEDNPALGVRGIRLCFARPALFRTQLRALYRASVYGRLCIMFPMIATVQELQDTLAICRSVQAELTAEGIAYAENVELGVMIETPSAAVISDRLAKLVDFFSIGTNDLTQYTLACDRQNPHLDHLNEHKSEAVLRLMEYTVQSAHSNGIWVGICGELASDMRLTETFLQMGVDELSVSPKDILPMRERIRSLKLTDPAEEKD